MNIVLNDQSIQVTANTLSDILQESGYEGKKGIAVAVNESVVPKNEWSQTELTENDKVLIITATQGG